VRSILAEAIPNHRSHGRFTAHSAGSHPTGLARPPEALQQIESPGFPTTGLRSKSWDEFRGPSAPVLDFVIHGVPDAAAVKGTPEEIARAFHDAFVVLDRRVELFLSLPFETLEQLAIKNKLDEMGRS
jgi:arsenate reductase